MLTVDITHFVAWCEGTLLDFKNGVGFVVNERECIEADKALQRGETVLLRNGYELTGTEVVMIDGEYHERNTDRTDRTETKPQ